MANTVIQLKRSNVSGRVPSSLEYGEVGINTADGILYYKDPSDNIKNIQTIITNTYAVLNVNSSLLIAASNSSILTIDSTGAITLNTDVISDKYTIGVKSGTTSQEGVVQLYDGINSTSTSYAATANSVKTVYDLSLNLQNVNATQNTSISAAYDTANSIINGTSVVKQLNFATANISSNVIVTSANTSNQVLDLFSTTNFRSAKYLIQVTSGTDYQISEILLLHNGTNSYIAEYGLIATNVNLMSYDTDISSGNVRLLMSPVNTINNVNVVRTSISV